MAASVAVGVVAAPGVPRGRALPGRGDGASAPWWLRSTTARRHRKGIMPPGTYRHPPALRGSATRPNSPRRYFGTTSEPRSGRRGRPHADPVAPPCQWPVRLLGGEVWTMNLGWSQALRVLGRARQVGGMASLAMPSHGPLTSTLTTTRMSPSWTSANGARPLTSTRTPYGRPTLHLASGCMSSPGGRALSPGWPSPTANSWRWVGCGIVVKLSGPNDRQSFVRTPTGSRKQRHECGRSSRTCRPPSAA